MTCDRCGRADLRDDELLVHEGRRICADCKPDYFQRLREGLPGGLPGEEPEIPPLQRRLLWITLHGGWCGLLLWFLFWIGGMILSFNGHARSWLVAPLGFALTLGTGGLQVRALVVTLRIPAARAPALLFFPVLLVCGALPVAGFFGCLAGVIVKLTPLVFLFLVPFAAAHAACGCALWLAGMWGLARWRENRE